MRLKPECPVLVRRLTLTLALLLSASNTLIGQQTAARPDRGANPGGSYSVSDIENINLQNGNVQLSIPLASLPPIAGGRLSFTLSANYNSKLWNITRNEQDSGAFPYRTYVVDTPQISDVGGWSFGGAYAIFPRDAREDFNYVPPPSPDPNDGLAVIEYQQLTQYNWNKMVLRTPDGGEHELRPSGGNYVVYNDPSQRRPYLAGYYRDTPDTLVTPIRYNTSDGTYLSAIVNPNNHWSGIRWTIFLSDGTQIISYSGGFQRIRDNNGNSIKIFSDANGTHYRDEQTNREIRTTYDPQGAGAFGQVQIWYSTVGGVPQHIDVNYGQTFVQGKTYEVQSWNLGAECKRVMKLDPPQMVPVVREIVLPATEANTPGRRFTFGYNSDTTESTTTQGLHLTCGTQPESWTRPASRGLGELNHLVTPSGASVDYTYSLSLQHDFIGAAGFLAPDHMARASIKKKELHHDGVTDTWEYHIPNESNSMASSVDNPDGSSVSQSYFPIDPNFPRSVGDGSLGLNGLVFQTSNGVTRTLRHWVAGSQSATGSAGLTGVNPLIDAEYTALVGTTLMSAKTFLHDYNGNVTQVKEYDWFDSSQVTLDAAGVPMAPPVAAVPLRVTNTSYHNSAPDANSANSYILRSLATGTPSILNAAQETTTGQAQVRLIYDGNPYGVAPTVGNLTSKRVWDDLDNKWITTSTTYNSYGNVTSATDALGKTTQFNYTDLTHALPNQVVVDPQNGTGTQTSTTVFDFNTGQVTRQVDPNGNATDIGYTNQSLNAVDPFGRPGIVIGPLVYAGGSYRHHQVTTTYLDSTRQVIVAVDLNNENDKLLKTRTTSDALGRTILTEQTEDGTNYTIYSRKAYVQMGKISFASNPMRYNVVANTDGWARTTTDVLGRVAEVATFGGSTQPGITGYANGTGIVTSTYDANFTTVTDQVGRVRRSKTDALGRLVRVDEPDSNNNLGSSSSPFQATYYGYSNLDNLLTTTQGAQTRNFTYDSLSRLRSATNPEVCNEQGVPVPVTYSYDDNGNLIQKTDARGVKSTYGYDALNRNTSVTYTDDPTNTPTVIRTYDLATNGKGRLYQAQTNGAAASATRIDAYDAMGQPSTQHQQFFSNGAWSPNFTTHRFYNLAGSVTAQVNPAGHTVAYSYDNAGRPATFSGNLGEINPRPYATAISYASAGQMEQEQFGTTTPIYNKLRYNSRQQLSEIRASTVANDDSWNRGKFINQYSLQCSGASCNSPDNNGNLRKQEVSIPNADGSSTSWSQQYEYDSLNRLTQVNEYNSQPLLLWKQWYTYDRFGNRRIDVNNTSASIPRPDFEVETATNRLLAPGDAAHTGVSVGQRKMRYDNAGNLVNDSWTSYGSSIPGAVTRTYDAENRMTAALDNAGGTTRYHYDADGRRVRRVITNQPEVWQVYGMDGELLAEYGQNKSPSSPQKEYGYRNGQLLVEVTPATTGWGPPPVINDNPLVLNVTIVQARHITELRTAIDALRTRMGMANFTWAYSATTNDWISANPVLELRTALDQALGSPSPPYSAGLAQGQPIKAIHIQELRDRVLTAWNNGSGGIDIHWMVTDQLGTPRMIFDHTGSLANVRRHDYLPFGEELTTQGLRNAMPAYSGDNVRQKFTSKERDVETNLDYFGARYYSSVQGRFTGVDIAGPNLSNPQSLNKYAYTLNNPLRYIDRNGLYEEDVHLHLTQALAEAAGFSRSQAWAIATGNQMTDETPGMGPFSSREARSKYHFTTVQQRYDLWNDFANAAMDRVAPNEMTLDRLGVFMHAQQDSYSHEGFGPNLGQGWPPLTGSAPDKTYNDPAKADRMAVDSFNRLTTAATVLYNNQKISFLYKPLDQKVLNPLIQSFNRARTPEEKMKIVTQIQTLARQNIQRQAEEAIRKKQEEERRKRQSR